MVYVGSDGRMTERRSPWRLSIVTDFLSGVVNAVLIFFRAVTVPSSRLTDQPRSNYSQRQGIRRPTSGSGGGGANIRRVRNLGTPRAMAGGG